LSLLNSVLKHLRTLKALKRPTDHWDDLMMHLMTSCLDQKMSRVWEVTLKHGEVPTQTINGNFFLSTSRLWKARYTSRFVSRLKAKKGATKLKATLQM